MMAVICNYPPFFDPSRHCSIHISITTSTPRLWTYIPTHPFYPSTNHCNLPLLATEMSPFFAPIFPTPFKTPVHIVNRIMIRRDTGMKYWQDARPGLICPITQVTDREWCPSRRVNARGFHWRGRWVQIFALILWEGSILSTSCGSQYQGTQKYRQR